MNKKHKIMLTLKNKTNKVIPDLAIHYQNNTYAFMKHIHMTCSGLYYHKLENPEQLKKYGTYSDHCIFGFDFHDPDIICIYDESTRIMTITKNDMIISSIDMDSQVYKIVCCNCLDILIVQSNSCILIYKISAKSKIYRILAPTYFYANIYINIYTCEIIMYNGYTIYIYNLKLSILRKHFFLKHIYDAESDVCHVRTTMDPYLNVLFIYHVPNMMLYMVRLSDFSILSIQQLQLAKIIHYMYIDINQQSLYFKLKTCTMCYSYT